jgi:hypothetical protein
MELVNLFFISLSREDTDDMAITLSTVIRGVSKNFDEWYQKKNKQKIQTN